MNWSHHQFRPSVLIILTAVLISCTGEKKAEVRHPKSDTLVLRYQDFGPQIMSYELIGMEWYQWNSQGPDSPSAMDDVRVVVYRNITLDEVKKLYPVVEGKQDYRYVQYHAALELLNKYKADRFWDEYPEIKEKMELTRDKILDQLKT